MPRVEKSIRVKAPVELVYTYWRNFESFPEFMRHVRKVDGDASGRRSHWKIGGPLGLPVEFDAELVRDEPNRMLGWKSTDGTVGTSGTVTFASLPDHTQVHVVLDWHDPPGGALGTAAAKLVHDPAAMLAEDLRRFKDLVEGRLGSGFRR